jgi:hypothetical protein
MDEHINNDLGAIAFPLFERRGQVVTCHRSD